MQMQRTKYAPEFKDEAVKQVIDKGHSVVDVANRLSPSMSRRGNCWDNAVAESFFSNLKSEQIKKQIYSTRAEAKSEIFDYIEGFYNRVRRHKHLDQLSPYEFERQRQTAL